MADVFVSYARATEPQARTIADTLVAAGYGVWWDRQLLPHHTFAQTIEREIRSAKAVVVVWSATAVGSEWVRAEADLARAQGKLVQVTSDDCVIPLPFSQYQAADLRGWSGDVHDPEWEKVVASVAQLTSRQAMAAPARDGHEHHPPASGADGRRKFAFTRLAAVVAGLVAVGGVLGAAWLFYAAQQGAQRGGRIAVQSFETVGQTPMLHDFAAELSDSLENALTQDQLQTLSRADADALRGPQMTAQLKALNVGLLFNGTVHADGDNLVVRTRLEDPIQHATLWSAEISGPSVQPAPLQAQVGARAVAVLNCSAQALNSRDGLPDPAVLETFLHACDLAETSHHGASDDKIAYAMLDAMRTVAREAPRFAAGHSVLAKHLAFLSSSLPAEQGPALRQEAGREAHRALQLNPKDPDAYVALGLLAPELDFRQRESILREALTADPAWPHANGFLGNVMTDVGRLQEAQALYQRATAANPQSMDWGGMFVRSLIWTGDTHQADTEINRLSALWPTDGALFVDKLNTKLAQKQWAVALAQLDHAGDLPGVQETFPIKRWRAETDALNRHDVAALQAARQRALAMGQDQPQKAITSLTLLGFVDDAYAVSQHYNPIKEGDDPDFLFSPLTAPLRRDPRFMVLAQKFGLATYWRETNAWPDFCNDKTLPYSCKQEVAKLSMKSKLSQ